LNSKSIGVIGVGAMGMGVAESLLRAGYRTYVRDIVAERMSQAEKLGAIPCASPAAMARDVEAIIILVVDAAQVEEVLFGIDGAAAALASGSTVIVSSTLAPDYVEALVLRLAERQLGMLDAPVSGGPMRAKTGTMTAMVAGETNIYQRYTDLLTKITGKVFYLGTAAGTASKVKLVNNLIAGVNLVAAAEAMALAIRIGLNPRTVFDVVNESSGASWVFRDRITRVLEGDYEPRAALPILTKDLSLSLELARAHDFRLPLGEQAHQVFAASAASPFGAEDDAAIIKYYQSLTGINLPTTE
jgi:L-threonate 2-dehydrogenase